MGMELNLLPSPLMQRRGTMLVREFKIMEERVPKEGRVDVTIVAGLVTMLESVQIKGTLLEMMTTRTTTTSGGMEIKGTTSSKERGRLPLIEIKMEMVNLSRGQGTPSMMNLTLLVRKMNIFLYLPSLLHLFPTPWTIG